MKIQNIYWNSLKLGLVVLPVSWSAAQNPDPSIKSFFEEFEKNPLEKMNTIPKKVDQNGKEFKESRFSDEQIKNYEFVIEKDKLRESLFTSTSSKKNKPSAEYLSHDNFTNLLDNPHNSIDNLHQIDSRNLSSATLPFQPWSDYYWPAYKGGIAYRYADPYTSSLNNFNSIKYHVLYNQPASSLINSNHQNDLSPSEKYDLLMGDYSFSLTNSTLQELDQINQSRPFEGWEGICDGWAIASFMYKRPVRSVKVYNPQGIPIEFYPSDIKALNTFLWAKHTKKSKITRMVGQRCNLKNPQTDYNGRILAQECFESNPGTVHLALINQIGIQQKGFVFDATYDYQVWNHPVHSYKYRYFNVNTQETFEKASDAQVPLNYYMNDPFRNYRSYKSTNVVGVELTLQYIAETRPRASSSDAPNQDAVVSVTYIYDLELDTYGRVIGGEWYQNAHPNFLWNTQSSEDIDLNLFNSGYDNYEWMLNYKNFIWVDSPRSPSQEWTPYSQHYAKNEQLPLDHIVKNLTAWASVNTSPAPENCKQPCVPLIYNWHN